MLRKLIIVAGMTMANLNPASANEPVLQYSAGSLRVAMTEIAAAFTTEAGLSVAQVFGASGLLRDRIAGGEKAEVFTSANMAHPLSLAKSGKAGPVVMFARNEMCALVKPGLAVTAANLVERMMDPTVKLATSTPVADPSGDYAFAVFAKAERLRSGAKAALEAKALKLVGGPNSPQPPAGRNIYAMLMAEGAADIFIGYCTYSSAVLVELPGSAVVQLPESLSVGADYGLTVMKDASPVASQYAMFILSARGQAILAKNGFAAPNLPKDAP